MSDEGKLLEALAKLTGGDPHIGVALKTLAAAAGLEPDAAKRIAAALSKRNRVALGHDGSVYPGR